VGGQSLSIEDYYTSITIKELIDNGPAGVTEQLVGFYKGFIQQVSRNEMYMQGKSADSSMYILYTPLATPTVKNYLIEQGTKKYIVTATGNQDNGISNVGHHKEVPVRIVT
jgi:hypothetical protein